MSRSVIPWLALLIGAAPAVAYPPFDSKEPVRIGPGVTPPRLIRKIEPEYTPEARAAHFGGTVVLRLVVDENGRPADMKVISPLGFGLDEQALAAVSQWRFQPGVKAGNPVAVLAVVEVNLRITPYSGSEKNEKQRTKFNIALNTLNDPKAAGGLLDGAVQTILKLSHEKFAPAMYVEATWKSRGEHGPKNEDEALELYEKAAARQYAPAMYEIALLRLQHNSDAQETEKGLHDMTRAATLGSDQASTTSRTATRRATECRATPSARSVSFACAQLKGSHCASTGWRVCCTMRRTAASTTIWKRLRFSNSPPIKA